MRNGLQARAASRPKRIAFTQVGLRTGSPRPPGGTGILRLHLLDRALMVVLDISTEQGSSNAFGEAPEEAMTKKD